MHVAEGGAFARHAACVRPAALDVLLLDIADPDVQPAPGVLQAPPTEFLSEAFLLHTARRCVARDGGIIGINVLGDEAALCGLAEKLINFFGAYAVYVLATDPNCIFFIWPWRAPLAPAGGGRRGRRSLPTPLTPAMLVDWASSLPGAARLSGAVLDFEVAGTATHLEQGDLLGFFPATTLLRLLQDEPGL